MTTPRRTEPTPPIRTIEPIRPLPVRRVEPIQPRVEIVRVVPRPRPTLPRLAECPSQSPPITYRQLDKVMGSSFTMQTARVLNRASGGTVYDAGLSLSQSWRNAQVLCKVDYLCDKITSQVQRYCRTYRPYPHCTNYSAHKIRRSERILYVCRR